MALSTATVSLDLHQLLGDDFDARRTKAYVTTNVESGTLMDTSTGETRLGDQAVTIAADGTGSFTTWTPGADGNPISWQTTLYVDYPRTGHRDRKTRAFGPYTITGTSKTVTNKALTSNVATVTTDEAHGLVVGNSITVAISDATFDGTFTITAVPSATTLSYAKTHADVASAAATGTLTSPNVKLTSLEEEQAVPAEYLTTVTAALQEYVDEAEFAKTGAEDARDLAEQYRDETHDISNIDTPDALVATLLQYGTSTPGALSDAVEIEIAESPLWADRVARVTLTTGQTYVATLDPITGADIHEITLTGDATLSIPILDAGRWLLIDIIQNSVGGHELTLPTASGDVTLTTTASTRETLTYRTNDGDNLIVQQQAGGGAPAPFDPRTIPNAFYLGDAKHLTGDPGDHLTLWPNRVPGGTVVLTTAGNTPVIDAVNGIRTLHFSQADNVWLDTGSLATLSSWTFVGIVKTDPAFVGTVNVSMRSITTGNGCSVYTSSNVWQVAGTTIKNTGLTDDHSWTPIVIVFNGTTSKIRIGAYSFNGTLGTTTAVGGIRLARGSANGGVDYEFTEMIDRAIDDTEIANLLAFLNARIDQLEAP